MKIYVNKLPLKTFVWKNKKYNLVKAEQHEKEGSDKPIIVLKASERDT